jgi:hypothetical protein
MPPLSHTSQYLSVSVFPALMFFSLFCYLIIIIILMFMFVISLWPFFLSPPTSLSVYMYKLINMLFFCTLTWAPDAGATFVP